MAIRTRKLVSVKKELLQKSKEAMLTAVQIFNNPNIQFKSESFIVLINIAWTYLLHAYYREIGVEYRYYEQKNKLRRFDLTKNGAYKYWELERCLNDEKSPVDKVAASNLRFLIGLRHEIEHQMTTRIDDLLSARFQACCLNYNSYLKNLFPKEGGIDMYLSFSLQFSSLNEVQIDQLMEYKDLPQNISTYIQAFDGNLTDDEFNSSKYSYRVLFVPKTANRKGQADRVIEFIKADSPLAETVNKEYAVIKETEKVKLLAKQIVAKMKDEGYVKFSIHYHTNLWQNMDAKKPEKGYGVFVAENYWYWYEGWVKIVREHCFENKDKYI